MSKKFEEVRLEWAGREYVIPANRVMGAIARIEDTVTLAELKRYHDRGGVPLGKMAIAFADVLSYAGATAVKSDDIYQCMFGSEEQQNQGTQAVLALLSIMAPPGSAEGNGGEPLEQTTTAAGAKSVSRRRGKH